MAAKLDLLENASSTGEAGIFDGGRARFIVVGNFSGAIVSLQALGPDGVTYVNVSGGLVVDGSEVLDLPSGLYKASVVGGVAPSGLYADLVRVSLY